MAERGFSIPKLEGEKERSQREGTGNGNLPGGRGVGAGGAWRWGELGLVKEKIKVHPDKRAQVSPLCCR